MTIAKPKKEPLILDLEYDRLKVVAPMHAGEVEVIGSSPPDRHFEHLGISSLKNNGSCRLGNVVYRQG
ncbi:MAG: hypothetical protein J7L11_05805 [Thermoprotei archaeon]|nr:hypothetical protein [Thermoprotei archaeon]